MALVEYWSPMQDSTQAYEMEKHSVQHNIIVWVCWSKGLAHLRYLGNYHNSFGMTFRVELAMTLWYFSCVETSE